MTRNSQSRLTLEMYVAALVPEHWNAVLKLIASETDAAKASLHRHEFASRTHKGGARIHSYGYRDGAAKEYATKWAQHDIWVGRIRERHPIGLSSGTSDDLLKPSELIKTSFYQRYALPNDIHHVSWISLENDYQFGSGVALVRPKDAAPFTREHVDTLRRLGPHLTQTFHIQRHFEHLQDKDTMLEKGVDRAKVAVIGLTADGRVTSMSHAANALLARRDPLRIEDGRIAANEPSEDHKLRQMLRAASRPLLDAAGGRVSNLYLKRADGKTSLHLEITPWGALLEAVPFMNMPFSDDRAQVMMTLSDPSIKRERQETFVRKRLGFKGVEAEIALLLFDRCKQKEIATKLGISDVSVRQHLHIMYAKAGVDGQLGLVQLMVDFLLED